MIRLIQVIASMNKRLNKLSRDLDMEYTCDVKIVGANVAHTQVEDGKTYKYPETIEIKIENHSNHFYSVRTKDARWVPEGNKMSGKGRSIYSVYRAMIKELKAHRAAIQARKGA